MLVWNALFMVSVLLAGTTGLYRGIGDIAVAIGMTLFYPIVGWLQTAGLDVSKYSKYLRIRHYS